MVINGEVVEPVAGTSPTEGAPVETLSTSPSPLDSILPIDQHEPGTGFESAPPAPEPLDRYEIGTPVDLEPAPPVSEPPDQHDIEASVDLDLALEESTGPPQNVPVLEPEPALLVDPTPESLLALAPEPVAFEETEPLLSYAEEAPALEPGFPYLGQEESQPPTSLGTVVNSAAETLESAANALGGLTDGALFRSETENEGLFGAALVDLFSGEEAGPVPTDEGAEDPDSPLNGTESSPRNDTPQPASPFAPLPMGGSSFSLSGGSEVGLGCVAPLLLCVLVSGSILLRRDRGISWVFAVCRSRVRPCFCPWSGPNSRFFGRSFFFLRKGTQVPDTTLRGLAHESG